MCGKLGLLETHDEAVEFLGGMQVAAFSHTGLQPADPDPVVTGFTCISRADRPHQPLHGGVACLVHNSIKHHATHVCARADLGIACTRIHLPQLQPVYVLSCYLPHSASTIIARTQPARNAWLGDWFKALMDIINEHTRDGAIIMLGDFNAHTGDMSEVDRPVVHEWAGLVEAGVPTRDLSYYATLHLMPIRANMDSHSVKSWGKGLLSFCADSNLAIMNGRVNGDEEGHFTLKDTQGRNSTLDYIIATPDLCFTTTGLCRPECRMQVHQVAWCWRVPACNMMFDHAPVSCTFALPSNLGATIARQDTCQGHKLRWKCDRQNRYATALNTQMAQGITDSDDPLVVHSGLVTRITEAAKAAGMCSKNSHMGGARVGPVRQLWFDDRCVALRAQKEAARNSGDHGLFRQASKVYSRYIRQRKREFAEQLAQQRIDMWYKEPKKFWKGYKGVNKQVAEFSVSDWSEYFSELYTALGVQGHLHGGSVSPHIDFHNDEAAQKGTPLPFPDATAEQVTAAEHLNDTITADEVIAACAKMQADKAAGVDGIPAEFLVNDFVLDDDTRFLIPHITRLFNLILEKGVLPYGWNTCVIAPVHKAGTDPKDKDNYRGIAIGTSLSKLFSMVLMLRMDSWAEEQGLRAKCQAGFRKGRSTTDNVFLLQHAIEASRANHKPLYAAFIDFKKAYDTINRQLLWRVLHGMGVHGHIFTVLQNLYTDVSLRVRVNGVVGDMFSASVGVRQGDPLSPLLFGIFIDRFENFLAHHCIHQGVPAFQSGDLLRALLYADDLTLLAESKTSLQEMLNCLEKFAGMNLMSVNLKKSKLMAFNATGGCNIKSGDICFGNQPLDVVQEFVFLGVTFHASKNRASKHVKECLGSNLSKARLAMFALTRRSKELGIHNVKVLCNLFNTLVLSVLNYCCPVWSVYHLQQLGHGSIDWGAAASPAEDLQRAFLRRICGAPDSVTVGVLMCELQRSPVLHGWCKQSIRWYNTIVKRPQDDLVRTALLSSISAINGDSWGQAFHNMVRCVDEASAGMVHDAVPISTSAWVQSLHDKWQAQVWGPWAISVPPHTPSVRDTSEEQRRGFKRTVYCLWFNDLLSAKGQQWIYHLNRQQQVHALAAFRMSFHKLNIEFLRRYQVPRHKRLCTYCLKKNEEFVEDEYHMLHECPSYADIRNRFTDVLPPRLVDEDIDAHMMRTMNLTAFDEGGIARAWKCMADFIISAMAIRHAALEQ